MQLDNGICHNCTLCDSKAKMKDRQPFLMSTDNNMDAGNCYSGLPELSQMEEMCIACAHVHMQLKHVHGHQYHYTGHCVSFMQSNIKFFDTLPLLPKDVNIILLQPWNSSMQDPQYHQQFEHDFWVHKGVILTWLQYLKQHHPNYHYISISTDNLSQLPEDGDIMDCILAIQEETDQASSENYFANISSSQEAAINAGTSPPCTESVVPNL